MSNKVDFDNYTDNYNQLLKEGTNFFSSNEEYFARYKIEVLRERVKGAVANVLEYGCGIGRNIPFLSQAFPNAVIMGSDISNASLDIARINNPGVEFFSEEGNVELPQKFDLIFVAGVFHHIPPDQRSGVARTLYDRLAPGGQIFVFEHNPYNPVTRRIVNNCPYDEDAVLLKPSELSFLLTNAAMTLVQKSYCLFVPPKLSAFSWLEGVLGWLPLGGQYWIQARRSQ